MGVTSTKITKEQNATAQRKYRRTYSGTIQAKFHGSARNARNKGLKFTLTIDILKDMWDSQRGRCAISGVKLGFVGSGWCAASIDRINPDLGYTPSNVQWTCWRVNEAKTNMQNQDFIDMCRAIAVYSEVRKEFEGATTISTLETIASGSAEYPEKDNDIVYSI
jgi:hypothetical protein